MVNVFKPTQMDDGTICTLHEDKYMITFCLWKLITRCWYGINKIYTLLIQTKPD